MQIVHARIERMPILYSTGKKITIFAYSSNFPIETVRSTFASQFGNDAGSGVTGVGGRFVPFRTQPAHPLGVSEAGGVG